MKKLILFLLPFSISAQSVVLDIDGNNYNTVTIGSQIWMNENLRTLRYNNGDSIPCISNNNTIWDSVGCCSYADAAMLSTYGRYYNWYAVSDNRKLCPINYHVPSKHDWKVLIKNLLPDFDTLSGTSTISNELVMDPYFGDMLKNTQGWPIPNTATNTTGFKAMPAGDYIYWATHPQLGTFWPWTSLGQRSIFLCSDDAKLEPEFANVDWEPAWGLWLQRSASHFLSPLFYKNIGYSVRCLADSQVVTTSTHKRIIDGESVYPNPFQDKIYIDLIGKVTIIDALGIVVHNTKIINSSYIHLTNIKSGIYTLIIQVDNNLEIKKIVKL